MPRRVVSSTPTEASPMKSLLRGAAFAAALTIAAPVWAQASITTEDLNRQELNQLRAQPATAVPPQPYAPQAQYQYPAAPYAQQAQYQYPYYAYQYPYYGYA